MSSYCSGLIDFYSCDDKTSLVLEETESSEQNEKENSEKEDFKEKDKITQDFDQKAMIIVHQVFRSFPDFFAKNTLVYLDQNTPPPEFS